MTYICHYLSPLGKLLLAADELGLTGIWFENQKHYASTLKEPISQEMTPVLQAAILWLDAYFAGKAPDFTVPVHFIGTDFQIKVWRRLQAIPYGQVVTYGQLAWEMGKSMSAQAVGNAVGKNPVSILVPCHRVMGARGHLTGYAAGIDIKRRLLQLEQINGKTSD